MSLIREINETAATDLFEAEMQKLEEYVDTSRMSLPELQKGYEAAARALGLVNTLKDPVSKKRHLSRVMTNLNKLRAALNFAYNIIDKLS